MLAVVLLRCAVRLIADLPAVFHIAAIIAVSDAVAREQGRLPGAEETIRSLAVLDPVDLVSGMPDEAAGAALRGAFLRIPGWSVLPADVAGRLLREHGIDHGASCLEFQCAFAAGNALQTEFVLFGTTASLPEAHAFSLGLAHVPGSQVVWSRAGESRAARESQDRPSPGAEEALISAVADLKPAGLLLGKRPSAGVLGILDEGPSTPHSRVVVHRALSHAYASRIYDLLGPGEVEELMAAMDQAGEAGTAPYSEKRPPARQEAMMRLGRGMGIRYLLRTRVHESETGYRMELAYQDVEKRRMVRYWPSRETEDFASLLTLESRFLDVLETDSPFPSDRPWEPPPVRPAYWKPAAFAAAAAAGAVLGYLSYRKAAEADDPLRDWRRDERSIRYGALSGLSVALGLAVWAF